jgi:hypothetical protein
MKEQTFTPVVRKNRSYSELPSHAKEQLQEIEPVQIESRKHYPCRVVLRNSDVIDNVYVVEASDYLYCWSVWPEDDPSKLHIDVSEISSIEESPNRIPNSLASELYEQGESGMGFVTFEMEFSNGERLAAISGNAVDFVGLPAGKKVSDIVSVDKVVKESREFEGFLQPPPVHFCLYQEN